MLFAVIERFGPGCLGKVAERFQSEGRLMPEGLQYVASWMSIDGKSCFQVIESDSRELLDEWIAAWTDLVKFEVTEVQTSVDFWTNRPDLN